jgi:hypothetical protein
MILWPVLLGLPPKHPTRQELARYALRAEIYVPLILVSLFATAVSSAFLMRAARLQFIEESSENLRQLVEGTLQDHRKKSEPKDPA